MNLPLTIMLPFQQVELLLVIVGWQEKWTGGCSCWPWVTPFLPCTSDPAAVQWASVLCICYFPRPGICPVQRLSFPLGIHLACSQSKQFQRADPTSSQSHVPSSGCSDGFEDENVTKPGQRHFWYFYVSHLILFQVYSIVVRQSYTWHSVSLIVSVSD